MEILKEENGVYVTPYTEEQFQMIRDIATEWNFVWCDAMKMDETTIDHIYECLMVWEKRKGYQVTIGGLEKLKSSFEFVKENISPESMKTFLLTYAKLQTELSLTREVILYQSTTITEDEFPEDLDVNDYDSVQSFAQEIAESRQYSSLSDGWIDDDEDTSDTPDVSIKMEIHTCNLDNLNIGYEGVAPTVEQEVA